MKIIGITGSSGSGKSTLTEILSKELNAKTIYSDKIVKKMQEEGTKYLKKIIETFGDEILTGNGKLNRKKLSQIIFSDETKRAQLNELTEDYVGEEIKKQIKEAKEKYVLIDAPLLIECGLNKICDIVIAVVSSRNTQIERICKRDNVDEKTAIARLEAQGDNEFYKKNADYIVENNGGEYDEFMERIRRSLQNM